MPTNKVYIVEELEALKGYCQERKQKQKSYKIKMGPKDLSDRVAKNTAPKYVFDMMGKLDFKYIIKRQENNMLKYEGEELNNSDTQIHSATDRREHDSIMAHAIEDTARQLVKEIQSNDHMDHIVDKITCKKVDIESLMRDKDIDVKTIDRRFSIHEHVQQKNHARAFRLLANYFSIGSTTKLHIGNKLSQNLSISERKKKNNSLGNGMVIFIDPNFYCEKPCILSISGTLPLTKEKNCAIEGVGMDVRYVTSLWSNGDPHGLELTSKFNLKGNLLTFGGIVPEKKGNCPRKSLPGWNGRAPMWVPFDTCECIIELISAEQSNDHHSSSIVTSKEDDHQHTIDQPETNNFSPTRQSQYNYKNTFSSPYKLDPSLSCVPYDTGNYNFSSQTLTPNKSSLKFRAEGDGAVNSIYLTAFPCSSIDEAIEKLTTLSILLRKKEVGTTTLSGQMPALNLACLHGNIIAARKLLKCGADPNRLAACTNSTPLHDAVVGGHYELMKLLLQHRANQMVTDDSGITPLHVCCLRNDIVGARILLADKHACKVLAMSDKKGRTPYMACSKQYLRDIIKQEAKKYDIKIIKEKKEDSAPWWSKLSSTASSEKPSAAKKTTADDFMKMAVSVANTFKGGKPVPKKKTIRL